MSTLELRHGDRALEVTLDTDGDHVRATVGEHVLHVERLPAPAPPYATAGAVVHDIAFVVDGQVRRAVVARLRDRVLVALGGDTYVFAAGDAARGVSAASGGTGKITAPMPGKVIAVLVATGDYVEHGQPVAVIEAMKMETTLTADVGGTVAQVAASAGETVEAGAVLVEITPG